MNRKSDRKRAQSVFKRQNRVLILDNVATRSANRKSRVMRGTDRGNRGDWGGRESCSQVESSRSIDFIALGWLYPVADPQHEHISPDKAADLLTLADKMTTSSEVDATDLPRRQPHGLSADSCVAVVSGRLSNAENLNA